MRKCESGLGECGEATVEFIAVVVIFLVPLFYALLTVGSVQSGVYAVEAATRNAARILSANPEHVDAAYVQADVTFSDYGLEGRHQVHIECFPSSCPQGSGRVVVSIEAVLPLPLLPEWLNQGTHIPVRSSIEMPIEGAVIR